MGGIIDAIEYLGIPVSIAFALIAIYLFTQIVGEIIELFGKAVPEFFKIRKFFARKKEEKQAKKTANTLKEVKQLLNDVNTHYNKDNITKRNDWMKGVDERAVTCKSQMEDLKEALLQVSQSLNMNTKMTEDMFVENNEVGSLVSKPVFSYTRNHESGSLSLCIHVNGIETFFKQRAPELMHRGIYPVPFIKKVKEEKTSMKNLILNRLIELGRIRN